MPWRLIVASTAVALALASCEPGAGPRSAPVTATSAGSFESEAGGGAGHTAAAGTVSIGRAGSGGNPSEVGLAGATLGAGASGMSGVNSDGCDAASVGELEVYLPGSNWDPLGYPPYAFDGCTLVYVASAGDPGTLRVRDLASGEETVLETAASKPRRPTVAGPVIAWEADGAAGSEVRVRVGGKIQSMSGAFVRAEEPRATDDAVVFTAFLGPGPNDDSDIYLFDVKTGQLSAVATGPGQQRFADVSPTHVAITDFSEDAYGYFNEAGSISDIALIERATGQRTNRPSPGKQAFPLLGTDGVFAYLEWAAVHPEPKLGQFWLKVGYLGRPASEDFNVKTTGQITTNPAYVRPSLRGLNLDFVDQGAEGLALYRAALDTPGLLTSSKISGGLSLFGPVAGERFTLLANQLSAQSAALIAVAR